MMTLKIKQAEVENILDLNSTQKGMLYHYLKGGKAGLYNVQLSLRIEGELQLDRFKESIQYVQIKNDTLRSVYRWEGISKPIQIVLKKCPLDVVYKDFSVFKEDVDFQLETYLKNDRQKEFDLSVLPLRFSILRVSEKHFVFVVTHHHILYDGWSTGVLLKEVFLSYRSLVESGKLPVLVKAPYAAENKNNDLAWSEAESQYWNSYLAEYNTTPFQAIRHTVAPGLIQKKEFSFPLMEAADRFSKQHNVTKAAIIHTIYGLLLQRFHFNDDIVFGTVLSKRSAAIKEVENMIGNFVKTIPCRVKTSQGDTLLDLVKRVNQDLIRNHTTDFSYQEIKEARKLGPDEHLFDTLLAIENYPLNLQAINGSSDIVVSFNSIHEHIDHPLAITVFFKEELEIEILYSNAIEAQFIADFAASFGALANELINYPDQPAHKASLLNPHEKEALLKKSQGNKTFRHNDFTIIDHFKVQAGLNADRIALIYGNEQLTYQELDEKSGRIANYLISLGAGKEILIPLFVERSIEMIVGLLAIIKSGAAYVPIDVTYPKERVLNIIEDTGATIVLTQSHLVCKLDPVQGYHCVSLDSGLLFETLPVVVPPADIDVNNLLYAIYTSGTTGKPKGTLVTHLNVLRVVKDTDYIHIHADDTLLQLSNFAFDGSIFDIFGALLNGASLRLISGSELSNLDRLAEIFVADKISIAFMTTALFNVLADQKIACLANVKKLLFGGELVSLKHVQKVLSLLGPDRLIHVYGPTESTVFATYYPINSIDTELGTVPIGFPIGDTDAYILDNQLGLLPAGAMGELYIAGDGIVRGYLNAQEETAMRFIPNPFGKGNLYKTGDLVRRIPDGNIEFIGRIDNQIKIRGFRIELGEIEHQLSLHPGLKDVIVDCRERSGDKLLVAYYVAENEMNSQELKQFLADKLPEYMIPSCFMPVPVFPLTGNGKVDKKMLPVPDIFSGDIYIAPSNQTESELAAIWAEVLNLPFSRISVDKSFFELGGHSLRAMVLTNTIAKKLGITIALRDIFSYPNIKKLSEYISKKGTQSYEALSKATVKDYYPLSSVQKRLYFLFEFDRSSLLYNMPRLFRLKGQPALSLLEAAFKKLISRHEILRTSFVLVNGEPYQQITTDFDFGITVYYAADAAEEEKMIHSFIRPFDLGKGPLLRVGLLDLGNEESLLLIDLHHIVMDGVSQGIFIRDFMALYNGEVLAEQRLQYSDYAVWQQSEVQQERLKDQRSFWLNTYQELPESLNLPLDHVRPVHRSHQGCIMSFEIGLNETQYLKDLAQQQGGTLFIVLLALYNILLSRLGNQEDIVVGVPTAGRPHADVDEMLGMFVNTLAMRNNPAGELMFSEFLSQVKASSFAYFEHQDYQYEDLIDQLKVERSLGRNPLFDVLFAYENFEEITLDIPGLKLADYTQKNRVAKFDLILTAVEKEGKLQLNFEYAIDIFNADTINRLSGYFERLVSSIIAEPDILLRDIEILSAQERQHLLIDFNGPEVVYPANKTVIGLFEEQVSKSPDRIAVVHEDLSLTYHELNVRVNQLAHYLLAQGLRKETLVPVCIDRSADTIIGMLGILKAGGTYVPIDPEYPAERIGYILKEVNAGKLLTKSYLIDKVKNDHPCEFIYMDDQELLAEWSGENPQLAVTTNDLINVIFTSGTTGKPKGVMVTHGGMYNLIKNQMDYLGLSDRDHVLQFSSLAFDAFGFEIFPALCAGAQLFIPARVKNMSIGFMQDFILQNSISVATLPPSYQSLLEDSLISLRTIVSAGEALNIKVAQKLMDAGVRIVNGYGPTEASVCVTMSAHPVINEKLSTIGKPLNNVKVYILDQYGRLCPIGVKGELCIGGCQLARGYYNDTELTAKRFLNDHFEELSSGKIYKTGDVARWLETGDIEFLGRIDDQVKIRGFRIELDEINHHLSQFTQVKESVVINKTAIEGNYLVAYFVADEQINSKTLRDYLLSKIPEYMIPSYFMQLDILPLTTHGKVNKNALPEPHIADDQSYTSADTEMQKQLLSIWAEVLGIAEDQISIDKSFFELGGNSIKIIKLHSKINEKFDWHISVSEMFLYPSIIAMIDFVENGADHTEAYENKATEDVIAMRGIINNFS
ncbi:amino acid adenylation domain-containing protein [Pedobacter cryoconitis]|uniref:Amino acid adenylation domain-containing protein n=1 Tax=Pedobacter cryoconitis TaxID=188932 RepID=A0A7W8ZJP1_9SPHI|nr:non-ribosomal peptide synthetase [Pedobacter cryoconitis]MBB5635105.1 amino acid adenylation domain-containing protein [Pedobacter cryoconitis]